MKEKSTKIMEKLNGDCQARENVGDLPNYMTLSPCAILNVKNTKINVSQRKHGC